MNLLKKFQCFSDLGYFEDILGRLEHILNQKNNNANSVTNRQHKIFNFYSYKKCFNNVNMLSSSVND